MAPGGEADATDILRDPAYKILRPINKAMHRVRAKMDAEYITAEGAA